MQKGIIAALLIIIFSTVPAQAMICVANPGKRVSVGADGALFVDFDSAGIVNICSLTATERNVSKEACTAWYSALLTYRAMGKKAQFYFTSGNPSVNANLNTCADLGDWAIRAPYYMEPAP